MSTTYIGTVLSSTHQEGAYPTQYSNIYDLRSGIIYLFYYYNYDEFMEINLFDELEKGYHSYYIPQIFSKVMIIAPEEGQIISGSSATFNWRGLPNSVYEIMISEEINFTSPSMIQVYSVDSFRMDLSLVTLLVLCCIAIFTAAKGGNTGKFKVHLTIICVCFLMTCDKDETSPAEIDNTVEFSKILSELKPNTTYYWKIRSTTETYSNCYTETIVYSFKTTSN
jgi:hypothetical protein